MALTAKKVRLILRYSHLVLGLDILCYIYSPFSKYLYFRLFTQVIVVPIVVFTGFWLWKFNGFNKFFGIRQGD